MAIRYIHSEGELLNSYLRFVGPQTACIVCLFVFVNIILALSTSAADYSLFPKDNWENETWLAYANEVMKSDSIWMIHRDGHNGTFNKDLFFRDQKYKKMGMARIFWGSTFDTYCWNDTKLPTSRQTFRKLPSIFRLFEFRPMPQAIARLTIIMLLSIRMMISFMRGSWVLVLGPKKSKTFRFLCVLTPVVVILESISAFLFCSLHMDVDRDYKFLIPYVLISFGVLCVLQMVLNVFIDMNDEKLGVSSKPFFIRATCFFIFITCFYPTYTSYMKFYRHKTCHPFVPWVEALNEYFMITSVFIYHLTTYFDFQNTEFMITPSYEDVVLSVSPQFYAAYSPKWDDMKKCDVLQNSPLAAHDCSKKK